MAAGREQPPARAGRDPAAVGGDDWSAEVLARSRELRARSQRLLARSQRLTQPRAAGRRQARPAAPAAGPRLTGQQPRRFARDLEEQVQWARATRARLVVLAADLVATEETVACIHDQLAAKDPKNAVGYRRAADDARRAARRIRNFQRNAAGAGPG